MARECDQFELAVSAYLDGELPKEEVRTLFMHLSDCEQCRAFMDTIRAVERRALTMERVVAAKTLDERVASIRMGDTMNFDGGSERSIALRSAKRDRIHRKAFSSNQRQLSLTAVATRAILVATIGFILGAMQPWSRLFASFTEPQVVFVSMLPGITVLGLVNELENGGKSK